LDCIERHLGVRYLRKAGQNMMSVQPATQLRAEAFAGLPAEVVAELREALLTLNVSRISEAIGKVSDHDSQLGFVLAKYAEKYAYTAVLKAIEDRGGDSSRASA
jgi:hypothetical protein